LLYAKERSRPVFVKLVMDAGDDPRCDDMLTRWVAAAEAQKLPLDRAAMRLAEPIIESDLLASTRRWVKYCGPRQWREFYTAGALEGERNDKLAKLAGFLLVVGCSPLEVRAQLYYWNEHYCRPPVDSDEIDDVAGNIVKAEARKFRGSLQ
jgi:hypothetical protein